MPRRASTNNIRGTRATTTRKKRTNYQTKLKYGKINARAQQGYIRRNAGMLGTLYKQFQSSKVYTDWKYDWINALPAQQVYQWRVIPMTDVIQWNPVMRQNITVNAANHTFVRNISINVTCKLNESAASLYWNIFLVRMRYPQGNRNFVTSPLQQDVDWVDDSQDEGENIRLNVAYFKVLQKRQFRLSSNTIGLPSATGGTGGLANIAGDSRSTSRRMQFNYQIKMKVSSPDQSNWRFNSFAEQAYYNKVYILSYCRDQLNTGYEPAITISQLATCINVE